VRKRNEEEQLSLAQGVTEFLENTLSTIKKGKPMTRMRRAVSTNLSDPLTVRVIFIPIPK
jgi:hypothetical protein